jgi:hypothetical protein
MSNARLSSSYERYALLTMTMLNGIFAALPCQFQLKIGRVRRQVEQPHAFEDAMNGVDINVAAKVAENHTKEAVNIHSFAMHYVCPRNHFQQFRECVACDIG